ncbi:insulin-like [Genypterus blacodes]|uniref:insulin-like n=1 Tax=Genypterus blacodes TaxID=154954 RepID=UPI003F772191
MACLSWATMLLLLVLHCPGVASGSAPAQYLCGPGLVDILHSVCGDRGFFHNPSRNRKRDLQPALGFPSQRARRVRLRRTRSGHKPKVKRGIVEECCHKPCSVYHLEGYCN